MLADRFAHSISRVRFLGPSPLAVLLATCLASGGCSLLLDFGEGNAADSGPGADAFFGTKCGDHEPNNSLAEALDAGLPTSPVVASICASTGPDFYKYTSPGIQTITITAEYVGSGDLKITFHDPMKPSQETAIQSTTGSKGSAILQVPGGNVSAQEYVIELAAAMSGIEADYTLTVKDGTQ